jgi:hypothetical protein
VSMVKLFGSQPCEDIDVPTGLSGMGQRVTSQDLQFSGSFSLRGEFQQVWHSASKKPVGHKDSFSTLVSLAVHQCIQVACDNKETMSKMRKSDVCLNFTFQ